jgi:membrane-associated phospholipid phosphatase
VDWAIFHWINLGWAGPFWNVVMSALSFGNKNAFWISVLVLAWLILLLRFGSLGRRAALILIPAVVAANLLSDVGKNHLGMLRPCDFRSVGVHSIVTMSNGAYPIHVYDTDVGKVRVIGEPLTSGGMPSAHAANNAAAAGGILFFFRRKAWWIVFLPLFVGLSRVYVGVHFPSQVFVGWLVGGGVGWVLAWVDVRIWPLRGVVLDVGELQRDPINAS